MSTSKSGVIAFSSLFEVNAKDADNVASEVIQIYHAVKYSLSCNALDCILKLNSKLWLSCGPTTSDAFVANVFTNNLKQHEPPLFFGLQTDASNHKNVFNTVFQYGNWHSKLCN